MFYFARRAFSRSKRHVARRPFPRPVQVAFDPKPTTLASEPLGAPVKSPTPRGEYAKPPAKTLPRPAGSPFRRTVVPIRSRSSKLTAITQGLKQAIPRSDAHLTPEEKELVAALSLPSKTSLSRQPVIEQVTLDDVEDKQQSNHTIFTRLKETQTSEQVLNLYQEVRSTGPVYASLLIPFMNQVLQAKKNATASTYVVLLRTDSRWQALIEDITNQLRYLPLRHLVQSLGLFRWIFDFSTYEATARILASKAQDIENSRICWILENYSLAAESGEVFSESTLNHLSNLLVQHLSHADMNDDNFCRSIVSFLSFAKDRTSDIFIETCAALLPDRLARFDLGQICSLLDVLSLQSSPPHALVQTLLSSCPDVDDLKPSDICKLAKSMAKVREFDYPFLERACDRLRAEIFTMENSDIVSFIRSVAIAKYKHERVYTFLDFFAMGRDLDTFSIDELSYLIEACSVLECMPPVPIQTPAPHPLALSYPKPEVTTRKLLYKRTVGPVMYSDPWYFHESHFQNPQRASLFNYLTYGPTSLPTLFPLLCDLLSVKLKPTYSGPALTRVVAALADLGLRVEHLMVNQIVEAFHQRIEFSPVEISSLLWTLHTVGVRDDMWVQQLADRVLTRLHDFSPSLLCRTAFRFALHGISHPTFMDAITEHCLSHSGFIHSLSSSDLSCLARAYALLNHSSPAMHELLRETLKSRLTPQDPSQMVDMIAIAWSLSLFNALPQELSHRLVNFINERAQSQHFIGDSLIMLSQLVTLHALLNRLSPLHVRSALQTLEPIKRSPRPSLEPVLDAIDQLNADSAHPIVRNVLDEASGYVIDAAVPSLGVAILFHGPFECLSTGKQVLGPMTAIHKIMSRSWEVVFLPYAEWGQQPPELVAKRIFEIKALHQRESSAARS